MTATAADLEHVRHAVSSDLERSPGHYTLDGVTPAIAFAPTDPSEVAGLLRAADEVGLAVAPLGARTAMALGRPLSRYDVALDLRALDREILRLAVPAFLALVSEPLFLLSDAAIVGHGLNRLPCFG